MKVAHLCLWTDRLEEMTDFYEEQLGFTFSREFTGSAYQSDVHNYYVTDETGLEIQFKRVLPDADESTRLEIDTSPTGMDHIALDVDDVDSLVKQIRRETDQPIVVEPNTLEKTSSRFAFVEDPQGYLVEFVEYLE